MADRLDAATETMIRNLAEKTGRTLEQWVQIAKKCGEEKHGAIVKHLKEQHGLTHGYANLVAHSASGVMAEGAPEGDALIDSQYAGEKAALRPAYDRLMQAVGKFGADVEVAPKKAYVSLRRAKQFAIVQPSTKSRLDVGVNLKGVAPKGRLEASGSFNAMVSHRVRVEQAADIDAELIGWVKRAYDAAG